ncbi:hypothetical protein [Microcystis phage Mae-JY35]
MSENTWMPIETAPTDGSLIIVTYYVEEADGWATEIVDADEDQFIGPNWGISRNISAYTHWMPLPTPPAHTPSIEQASS